MKRRLRRAWQRLTLWALEWRYGRVTTSADFIWHPFGSLTDPLSQQGSYDPLMMYWTMGWKDP